MLETILMEFITKYEPLLIIISSIVALCMATFMIYLRVKVSESPTNRTRILLPPLFMSSGALMFVFPYFRISFMEVMEALVLGLFFSVFLIRSTTFTLKNNDIYLIPSRAFIFILFGLLFIRIIIKLLIGSSISFGETSGMFYLLGFFMIVSWRIAMLVKYNKLAKKIRLQ